MGRIVDGDGRPLSGTPTLRFQLFHEGNGTPLCQTEVVGVPLVNGIYHVELNFACDLQNVIATLPPGMRLLSRVTDITDLANPIAYDLQTIMSVPMALRAEQAALAEEALTLADQGASDGQFLRWNSGSETWQPYTLDPDDFGTVQSLQAQAPIEIAGTAEEPEVRLLFNATHFELSGSQLQLNAGAITDAMISASADIAQSKIAGLPTRLTTIESDISDLQADTQASLGTGDPGQYLDHDLTWQDLDTSVVPEGTRLYFTEDRVLLTELDGYDLSGIPATALSDGDTLLEALAKLELMISTQSDGDFMRDGSVTMTGALRFEENSNEISLTAPSGLGASVNYILPVSPSAGYFLQTDSDGVLSWQPIDTTSGSITSVDRDPASAITTSTTDGAVTVGLDLTELTSQLTGKEDTITAGATTQYFRGDKTWVELDTDVVPEGSSNRYFAEALVLASQLTGFTAGSGVIDSSDTVLTALEKLTGNLADLASDLATAESALETYVDDEIAAAIASVDQSKWEEVTGGINYDQGLVGIGVDNPLAALHLNGSIIISDGGESCDGDHAGMVRYISSELQYCDASDWVTLGEAGAGGPPSGSAGGDLDGTYPNPTVRAGVIDNSHIAAAAAIEMSKIDGLSDALDDKQDALPSGGTSADYLDGDNTWQVLNTAAVAEHIDNLYFTQERVRTTPLAGYVIGTATALSPGDTVLGALAKLEALILNTESRFPETAATEGQILRADSLGDLVWSDLTLTDLDGVPETRELTAGAGLTGGGDLSADRSLAVVVDNQTIEIDSNALQLRDGGVHNQHIAADAEIAMSKIAGLIGALDDKQDGLNPSGNTAHLLDGGGNWRTLASADIPNLDASKINAGELNNNRVPRVEDLRSACPSGESLVSNGTTMSCVATTSFGLWSSNGARVYYSGGNVGIGTNTPNDALEVRGGGISLPEASGTSSNLTIGSSNHQISEFNDALTMYANRSSNNAFLIRSHNNGGSFRTDMSLVESGSFGINVASPRSRFQIHHQENPQDDSFLDDYALSLNNPTNSAGITVGMAFNASGSIAGRTPGAAITLERLGADGQNSEGDLHFSTRTGGATASPLAKRMTITAGGNVGIGTTSPSRQIEVSGNSTTRIRTTNTSVPSSLEYGVWSDGIGRLNMSSNYDLRFRTNNIDRMTIRNSGNVGIGTTTPQSDLDVDGNILASNLIYFASTSSGGTDLCFSSSATFDDYFYIRRCSSSSERYKENIRVHSYGLDSLMKLRPVLFDYRPEYDTDKHEDHIGFIAEEVEAVVPELAVYDAGQIVTVDYAKMSSVIVKGIQEFKELFDQLRGKVMAMISQTDSNTRSIASHDRELEKLRQENEKLKKYLCTKDPEAPFCLEH